MEATVRDAGIEPWTEIDGEHYSTADVASEYRRLHNARRAVIAKEIAEREEAIRGFIRNIPKLTSDAMICMAEEEMERLRQEVEGLKREAQPLDEKAKKLRVAIAEAHECVREARKALEGPSGRHKAEALRKYLRRIVLTFTPTENPGRHDPTSILTGVTFEPLDGDGLTFDTGVITGDTAANRRNGRNHLLSRTFSGEELRTA